MKIQRFNENNLYSEYVEHFIKINEYDKEHIKYYLTKIGDKPESGASFKKLEDAIVQLSNYYNMVGDGDLDNIKEEDKKYCIYKTSFVAVSQEEIDMIQKSKKYNI